MSDEEDREADRIRAIAKAVYDSPRQEHQDAQRRVSEDGERQEARDRREAVQAQEGARYADRERDTRDAQEQAEYDDYLRQGRVTTGVRARQEPEKLRDKAQGSYDRPDRPFTEADEAARRAEHMKQYKPQAWSRNDLAGRIEASVPERLQASPLQKAQNDARVAQAKLKTEMAVLPAGQWMKNNIPGASTVAKALDQQSVVEPKKRDITSFTRTAPDGSTAKEYTEEDISRIRAAMKNASTRK